LFSIIIAYNILIGKRSYSLFVRFASV